LKNNIVKSKCSGFREEDLLHVYMRHAGNNYVDFDERYMLDGTTSGRSSYEFGDSEVV